VTVDVLAVGAHPDDAELGIGGLIHKLTSRGYAVGMLDLTRGEMSTRGSVDERAAEALEAACILGVRMRANVGLQDGALANTTEQQRAVIAHFRALRPRILIIPMEDDRHPDHRAAHAIARDANYFSGLAKIETDHEPYRTPHVYLYHPYFEDRTPPQFVVNVSEHFDPKLAALKAHASQFHNPGYEGQPTYISTERFWNSIETRAAYWGHRIGVRYGEPLFTNRPIALDVPFGLEEQV